MNQSLPGKINVILAAAVHRKAAVHGFLGLIQHALHTPFRRGQRLLLFLLTCFLLLKLCIRQHLFSLALHRGHALLYLIVQQLCLVVIANDILQLRQLLIPEYALLFFQGNLAL